MLRRAVFAAFLCSLAGGAFAQSFDLSGTWIVQYQFQHRLGDVWADDFGVQPFSGSEESQALASITFGPGGIGSIELADGTKVSAFYRPWKLGIRLQPQGGRDTMLYMQPIGDGRYLGGLTWTVPEGSYVNLLLVLARK